MHVSKREQCAGEIANRIGLLRELDADYPYSCIQAAREGKFDILDEPEIERIKRILSLKLFLYSPLRCMHILKILIEKEEIQKPGKILDELRKRGLVDKKMNVTDLKEKYLENLVYFGFLEASGKNKGRKYGISSRFKTLRRQVPPVLLWLIEDEPCFIDQMWNVADEFNQKFGEVEYISKDGKKSEDFDIQKILYSLMSCKASCEDSRRILREMEIQENFYPGISKNRIVLDLIKTAENLGFQEIKEEMVKKASEFLDLIYVDGENQRLLNNDVIKKVIEDYLIEQRLIISKNLSKNLSEKILSFLIAAAATGGRAVIKRDGIIEGMKWALFDELDMNIEELGSEPRKILDSIRFGIEKPEVDYFSLISKISHYFLIKNRFIIQEEDALRELIADLTRDLPEGGASPYKRLKIEIIGSIKGEIEAYFRDIDKFVKLLQFIEKTSVKRTRFPDEKLEILKKLSLSMLKDEKR